MHNTLFSKIILIGLLTSLAGCKQDQPLTRVYLLTHPDVLRTELLRCQDHPNPDCSLMQQDFQEYIVLNNQRQENPEDFGKMILQAQQELSHIKRDLQNAKNEMEKKPNDASLQANFTRLNEKYTAQLDKVNIYLSVVSTTAPE